MKKIKRVTRGQLSILIKEVESAFELEHGSIKLATIRKREQRGNLMVSHPGPHSPVEPMEEYLCMIMIQRARMGQPLSVTKGINLVNSIISGTHMESAVIEFKKSRKFYKRNTEKEKKEKVN